MVRVSQSVAGDAEHGHAGDSSSRTTVADYRAALTTPGSTGPVLASLLARLPIAMIGMSALLYIQHETDSFATAGLVSAGSLVGVSLGAIVQGRLIDRFGPTRPLLAVTTLSMLMMTGLIVSVESRAATFVLLALAVGVGMNEPMVGSASRALWSRLLPPGPTRAAAYSYEAISMEVFFILGPGLAGLLVAAPWPGTGVIVGAACQATGATSFALCAAVRAWRPAHSGGRRMLGALASPGMRTLAVAVLGFGMVIGFVEVAVPAAATRSGQPTIGGLLLSVWSVSSVAFGIAYSLRPWPRAMSRRLPTLLGMFGVLVSILAAPSTLWGLALAMLVAGALITPQSTTHSTAIELVAPKGTAAEAFGWVLTGVTLGIAAGQSVSGYLVEHGGPPMSFLAASAAAIVLAGVVWLLRGTIRPFAAAEADPAHFVGAAR